VKNARPWYIKKNTIKIDGKLLEFFIFTRFLKRSIAIIRAGEAAGIQLPFPYFFNFSLFLLMKNSAGNLNSDTVITINEK
jgi:hypothetical protein